LRSCGQLRGERSAPSPIETFRPSNWLAASISRSSVANSSRCESAIGAAVCCARCSGEATTCTMSLSRRCSATVRACR
jgi:hypothetical protein